LFYHTTAASDTATIYHYSLNSQSPLEHYIFICELLLMQQLKLI